MSLNYASSLSPYANKGKCGQREIFDSVEDVHSKCEKLANMIKESNYMIAITGAGISTSAGIPDFRGPNGVWTLEKKGELPKSNISFEEAKPSFSHYALVELNKIGKLKFLISQNIDGLHMRSGFPLNSLAELHGNMFMEKCNACLTKFVSSKCVQRIGLKPTGKKCTKQKIKGNCRGEFHDTILDWENELPGEEMRKSELNSKKADLCICLGTTLQIMPVGNYPLLTKKNGGKIVIINLQATRLDKSADLIINNKLDFVFGILFEKFLKIKQSETKNRIIEIRLKSSYDEEETKNDSNDLSLLLLDVSSIIIDQNYANKLNEMSQMSQIVQSNKMESFKIEALEVSSLEFKLNNEFDSCQPHVLLIFSGKRKSGKDYICNKLVEYLKSEFKNIQLNTITLSAPLKEIYAIENGLDYEKLLDSSDYKEKYRLDMINWSDSKRAENPFFFCEKSIQKLIKAVENTKNEDSSKTFHIWIVTDARRQTDLNFFQSNYPSQTKTVRVLANESIRISRNWIFTKGVDDSISECDLDSISDWDFIINNNNDTEMNKSLESLLDYLRKLSQVISN